MYYKIDIVLVALLVGCKFSPTKLGIFEGFVLKSIQTPVCDLECPCLPHFLLVGPKKGGDRGPGQSKIST